MMKRLMMTCCLVVLTLAFAGAAVACPIANGWYIQNKGPSEYLYMDWGNNKNLKTVYTTYTAKQYVNKKVVKEYKAYALNPSLNQNAMKGHTKVNGADYFNSMGMSAELNEIQRHFQISHYIQANNKLANKDMALYQKYLMLSVWEVMMDGTDNFDLFSGTLKLGDKEKKEFAWFKATQDHYAYLFDTSDFKEHHYDFYVLVNGGKDGYKTADMLIFEYETRTPPAVPIPGAVWLMGTGVAGLVAIRRKKAQK